MTESQRQTWMRKQVKELVDQEKRTRKQKGKTPLGKKALFELDPRDRPKNPKKSGKAPVCHAAAQTLAREFKEDCQAPF